ncbi:MAG: hypothetical protein M4579_001130 [Chaenotheca gracillima]|nr:MAG: hypothetical protein M4579_001130 [Chaenotheca gracillima]
MYSSPHYTVPPAGYGSYEYTSPLSSPSPGGYYPPHYPVYTASPGAQTTPKRHSRRASDAAGRGYSSSRAPQSGGYYASPGYSSGGQYAANYSTPPPRAHGDYVSSSDRVRTKFREFWSASAAHEGGSRRHASYTYPQNVDSSEEDLKYDYVPRRSTSSRYARPSTHQRHQSYGPADEYVVYEEQVPVYEEAEPTVRRSRARRSSHSTRPKTSPATPHKSSRSAPKPTKPSPVRPLPVATEEDRVKAKIPAGYSLKNWDPTEVPILLLGSVFDANSLGKWIYDWTVFHHGAATPMSEIAGELWLLMIQLGGKMKRAEECLPRIRKRDNAEMVEDFLESGERLWDRFSRLLKACEHFMWQAAKRDSLGGKAPRGGLSMGKSSGCEFVDSIFGRDRELERTEKLMTGMRLWSMRFDANCEEILRHPTV